MSRYIPILIYHNIVKTKHSDAPDWIDERLFREQLEYITNAGFTSISPDLLLTPHLLPKKPILITFDDGYEGTYELAFPLLQEFNMKFTIFIITSFLSNNTTRKTNSWNVGDRPVAHHLSKEMIQEMLKSNLLTVGSHSLSHQLFHHLLEKEIEQEVALSLQSLKKEFNQDIHLFSYPGGYVGDKKITYNILKANGVKLAFGAQKDTMQNLKKIDHFNIKRINVSNANNFVNKKAKFRFEILLIPALNKISKYNKLNFFINLLLVFHQFASRILPARKKAE
jgi:peptidoglycan/xylan/chitin deacetylase (PgdA/CDA1 family)